MVGVDEQLSEVMRFSMDGIGGKPVSMLIDAERLSFLKDMTRDVVEACRIRPEAVSGHGREQDSGESGSNTTGRMLIVPGGPDCWYPAFWIEDLTLSMESGYVLPEEVKGMLELTLETQRGSEEWHLESGAVVPPFAVANHILVTGEPVYFPGTYSPGPDQGGEPFGLVSQCDDNFYAIEMCHWYIHQTKDTAFLKTEIKGMPVMERLRRAFEVAPCETSTQVINVTKQRRAVNWGFVDSINMTGNLLFSSLLKLRACRRMASLCDTVGEIQEADVYRQITATLLKSIPEVFASESGWLLAATEQCCQHDVWGTAYAIYEDALAGDVRQKALEAILKSYRDGTSTCRGNVRHILTTEDWDKDSAWEVAGGPHNIYQNGAYWGTPVGWFLYALSEIDPEACSQFTAEYVDELIDGDYRRKGTRGSPLECFHPGIDHWQNRAYMTSVTCPVASLRRLGHY